MKHQENEKTRNQSRILSLLLLSILLLAFLTVSVTAFGDADKKDVLTTLYDFHKAAQDENLEKYFSVQEMEYYKQLYKYPETYESYIQSTFDAFDTLDFSIEKPTVLFDNDSALVFYRLKATVVLTETGEKKKIDNDMVALLFKHPDGWKLRWSILHTLFEQKLLNEVVFDTAIDDAVFQTENTTLKQLFKEKGIYEAPEDEVLTPTTHHSLLPWILLIITLIMLFIYFRDEQRRKRCVALLKPATKRGAERMKNLAKKGSSSAKHATLKGFEKMKPLALKGSSSAKHATLKGFEKMKPLAIKGATSAKHATIKGVEKMKPLAKKGAQKMKTTFKKAKEHLQEKNSKKQETKKK